MPPSGYGPRGSQREKQAAAETAVDLAEDGTTNGLGTGSLIATSGQSAYSPASYRTHPTTLEAPWLSRRFHCSSPMSTARSLPRQGSYRPDDRRGGEAEGGQDTFCRHERRPPRGLSMLIEPLELSTPIAAFNGGLIARPDMTVIEQQVIPDEVTPAAIELLNAHAMSVWTYRGTDWFVLDPQGPCLAREARTVGFDPTPVESFTPVSDGVTKIVGVSDNHDAVQKTATAVREQFGDHVSASRSLPYYADVTHPQANKGGVVRYLSRRYRIPAEKIAAIGDGPNDVLMFVPSGLSIAMGNVSREVRRAARRVTTTNEDEGFANGWSGSSCPDPGLNSTRNCHGCTGGHGRGCPSDLRHHGRSREENDLSGPCTAWRATRRPMTASPGPSGPTTCRSSIWRSCRRCSAAW